MSRKRNRNRNDKSPSPPMEKPKRSGSSMAATLILMIVWVAGLTWWGSQHISLQPPEPAQSAAAVGDYLKLRGKWVRPDGGYVIDVRGVEAGGKLDAAYYNPHPIHVARAEAQQVDAGIRMVVELRDVNYPGSTYNLAYDARNDRLVGLYYQAIERHYYNVYFARVP